jgi:hypothetical protein
LNVTPYVPSVEELLDDLLAAVSGLTGLGTSLVDKLMQVQTDLLVPDVLSACSGMDDFKSLVAAQSGKKIDPPLAAQLTADAEEIEAAIPCP